MNKQLNLFRVASRELFNGFFRVDDPYENNGWEQEELFRKVQDILFESLVVFQTKADNISYGEVNRSILVLPTSSVRTPIMINREINSGYWDYPLDYAPVESIFHFIEFFDWDQLSYKDNRYVKVEIALWPEHPEVTGKQALIETQYVEYKNA